ncbi:MAG: hypothetical protein Q8P76_04270 [bacterium]|nr:hypothetical protein [bacterium]
MNNRRRRYRYTTYLAGPMQAVAHSGAGWRVFFTKLLERYGVRVQNPVTSESKKTGMTATRTKSFLKVLAPAVILGDKYARKKFRKIMGRIKRADFRMVDRCHFIIAQVIEGVVSQGTSSEIKYAADKKIPVYVLYSGRPQYFSHWLLDDVLASGGRVFLEEKRHGFKKCLDFLRSRFALEEFERNGKRRIERAKNKADKAAAVSSK